MLEPLSNRHIEMMILSEKLTSVASVIVVPIIITWAFSLETHPFLRVRSEKNPLRNLDLYLKENNIREGINEGKIKILIFVVNPSKR